MDNDTEAQSINALTNSTQAASNASTSFAMVSTLKNHISGWLNRTGNNSESIKPATTLHTNRDASKKVSHAQAEKYLAVFGQSLDDFEGELSEQLAVLIDSYAEKFIK